MKYEEPVADTLDGLAITQMLCAIANELDRLNRNINAMESK